jgi:hypothetical protein
MCEKWPGDARHVYARATFIRRGLDWYTNNTQ